MAKKDNYIPVTYRLHPDQVKTVKATAKKQKITEAKLVRNVIDKGLEALKITVVPQEGYSVMLCELSNDSIARLGSIAKFNDVREMEIVEVIVDEYLKGK